MNTFGKYLGIGFMLLMFGMGYFIYSQSKDINKLKDELEKTYNLAAGNVLPENIYSTIEILKNSITEIQRIGPDSVYIFESYLPPESEVTYITELDSLAWNRLLEISSQIALLEETGDTLGLAGLFAEVEYLKYHLFSTTVDFDSYGTCMGSAIGLGANNEATPELVLGSRLFYYNRFGVGLNGVVGFPKDEKTEFGVGAFVDGRIPRLNNIAGFIGGGYNITKSDWNFRVGLQGYLN